MSPFLFEAFIWKRTNQVDQRSLFSLSGTVVESDGRSLHDCCPFSLTLRDREAEVIRLWNERLASSNSIDVFR